MTAWVVIAALWTLGFCVTIKIEAMLSEHRTDYSALLNPLCWAVWPIIALLYLHTHHAARTIIRSKGRAEVVKEDWVY